jgi:hypothetical protein
MPSQKGSEAQFGRFHIVERLFTLTTQITNGVVFDRGDIDLRESTGAHQPRQWTASRRSVLTWLPAFVGIQEGATTQQT